MAAETAREQWRKTALAAMANYIDAGSIRAGAVSLPLWATQFGFDDDFVSLLGAMSSNAISAGIVLPVHPRCGREHERSRELCAAGDLVCVDRDRRRDRLHAADRPRRRSPDADLGDGAAGGRLHPVRPLRRDLPRGAGQRRALGAGAGIGQQSLFQLWSGELFPTLLRSTVQGFMFGVVRVALGGWVLLLPTVQEAGFRTLAIVLAAMLIVSGLIGISFAPDRHTRELHDARDDGEYLGRGAPRRSSTATSP